RVARQPDRPDAGSVAAGRRGLSPDRDARRSREGARRALRRGGARARRALGGHQRRLAPAPAGTSAGEQQRRAPRCRPASARRRPGPPPLPYFLSAGGLSAGGFAAGAGALSGFAAAGAPPLSRLYRVITLSVRSRSLRK